MGSDKSDKSEKAKILVIYAYYEKDEIYKNNLEFFLKKGIYDNDDKCDYIIVVNGESSVRMPHNMYRPNVKVLYRENTHHDFGAYDFALKSLSKEEYQSYIYYLFLNTSVRGPFMPQYTKLVPQIKWYEPFINLIKNDTKLVGTTINILNSPHSEHSQIFERMTGFKRPHTHLQSMMFAMDRECLEFLINKHLFDSTNYNNMTEFIALKEIMMSQLVLKNNWNISCIIPEYQNIDYRTLTHDINFSSYNHDPCFPNSCFGRTIHPYECIFIKTNRGIVVNEINSISNYEFQH